MPGVGTLARREVGDPAPPLAGARGSRRSCGMKRSRPHSSASSISTWSAGPSACGCRPASDAGLVAARDGDHLEPAVVADHARSPATPNPASWVIPSAIGWRASRDGASDQDPPSWRRRSGGGAVVRSRWDLVSSGGWPAHLTWRHPPGRDGSAQEAPHVGSSGRHAVPAPRLGACPTSAARQHTQGRRRSAHGGSRPPRPGTPGRLWRLRGLGAGRGRLQADLLRVSTRCSTAARSRPASRSATAGRSWSTRTWVSSRRSSTSRRSPR